jgi:hypothetical protein
MTKHIAVFVSDFFEELDDIFFIFFGSFYFVGQVVDDPDAGFIGSILEEFIFVF